MDRILIKILIVMFAALGLAACNPQQSEVKKEAARIRRSKTPNNITWSNLNENKEQKLDSKTVQAGCKLDILYIVPTEYEKVEILEKVQAELNFFVFGEDESYSRLNAQEAIAKYADDYVTHYMKEAKSQIPLWNKVNGGAEYFSYNKKITTEVLYNEANLISYQVKTEENKGSTTSTITLRNVILDLNNGTRITEDNIFIEGYKARLSALIIDEIIKDNDVAGISELKELGYWGIEDLATNNNFYVDKDGITYVFSQEEYADASLGAIEVFISFDDMMDLFKEESPITILIHDI